MDEFIGIIKLFAGNFAPKGWAFCQGQLLSIAQNQALFSILGTTYGGDGRTTFALPDLRGRVPVGTGAVPGLSAVQLGQMAGEATHTLLHTEMPAHTHALAANNTNANASAPQGNTIATPGFMSGREFTATLGFNSAAPNTALNPQSIGVAGSNLPHNNMQPYLGLNYIICMQGLFPPRD